ncbi:ESCRT-III subunit protein VPS20 NDAI_0K02200 [Naumovozyma dairenensis CBS 421]|uniref:Uncharacterized protein n=1 Tax=Naumovozyma dairenensis (strain ATCC 10597 / BCRC 20456 / CBS 421 / NBRC 0211 / NRRL Y-12639) TaxID=1071378 RepID=G0WI00_NAUDC|nr:hypothetical protein NDAI_0K02200 [Naumovozyma dairenensis CBS 421]CCD27411.1 hypothetical protein NDAI_0K02200 [Naumovozyma dairenensis CBS 421]
MVSTLEFKMIETQFFNGLKNGNIILTKLNKEFENENIDQLMENVQDQIQYQNEVDNILSQSITGVDDFEEEIDKELDQLEAQIVNEKAAKLPSTEGLKPIILKDDKKEEEIVEQEEQAERHIEQSNTPVALLS